MWAEIECAERELSESCLNATAVHRQKFKQLGFTEVGFKKLTRVLDVNHRDNGGINFLDSRRCYYGQLIYNKSYRPAIEAEREKVLISFTAVFENEIQSFSNETTTPFESLPHHTVTRIELNDAGGMYEKFVEHLAQRTDKPRHFPDLESLRAWNDAEKLAVFEERVRQGKFVRMSDYEVTIARSKLPANHP